MIPKRTFEMNYYTFKETFKESILQIYDYNYNKYGKKELTVYSILKELQYLTLPFLIGKRFPRVHNDDFANIVRLLAEMGFEQTTVYQKDWLQRDVSYIAFKRKEHYSR